MLIYRHTVGHNDDKPASIMKIRQGVMYFLILDSKLIQRDNGIILVQHQVVNLFLFDNIFHHAKVVDHGGGFELLVVEEQIVCYFEHGWWVS